MSTSTSQSKTNNLTTRDFINIGVFTALMFVIIWVGGMLGFFGPIMMFPGFFISLIANGIVFALFTARTPKMWSLTIILILMECLFAATGHWVGGIAIGAVFGVLADLVITRGPKKLNLRIPLAYALFSLPIYVSPWIPIFINADAYMAQVKEQMNADYAEQMAQVITHTTLIIFYIALVIVAFGAGILGVSVARKHFERAGLV